MYPVVSKCWHKYHACVKEVRPNGTDWLVYKEIDRQNPIMIAILMMEGTSWSSLVIRIFSDEVGNNNINQQCYFLLTTGRSLMISVTLNMLHVCHIGTDYCDSNLLSDGKWLGLSSGSSSVSSGLNNDISLDMSLTVNNISSMTFHLPFSFLPTMTPDWRSRQYILSDHLLCGLLGLHHNVNILLINRGCCHVLCCSTYTPGHGQEHLPISVKVNRPIQLSWYKW